MVNESGILYTIEGLSASILMITTAYLVVSTTMVFTPGDSHIIDMQLEQIGNDALAVMDTPVSYNALSPLESSIKDNDPNAFRSRFLQYINTVKPGSTIGSDKIKFFSEVFYRKGDRIESYPFADSGDVYTGREHMVKVSRMVFIRDASIISALGPDNRPQSLLIEVTLWRE